MPEIGIIKEDLSRVPIQGDFAGDFLKFKLHPKALGLRNVRTLYSLL